MHHSKSEIAVKRGVSATILIWFYSYMHRIGFQSLLFSHSWELFYSFVALLVGDIFVIFCTVLSSLTYENQGNSGNKLCNLGKKNQGKSGNSNQIFR